LFKPAERLPSLESIERTFQFASGLWRKSGVMVGGAKLQIGIIVIPDFLLFFPGPPTP
jgi:hypothetical protein